MRTQGLIFLAVALGSAVRPFLEAIEPMMDSGLVTVERVQVIRYGAPQV